MTEPILAFASVLSLTREEIKVLKIKDDYTLHKIIYGLFEDMRSDKDKLQGASSGILYADKDGDLGGRNIILLSDRKPHQTPQFGTVKTIPIAKTFLDFDDYAFEVVLNPVKRSKDSGKLIPIREKEQIIHWFIERSAKNLGFKVDLSTIFVTQESAQVFEKSGMKVTNGKAIIKGRLRVTNRDLFIHSFLRGIGRGKAFGFGLLQIAPLKSKLI